MIFKGAFYLYWAEGTPYYIMGGGGGSVCVGGGAWHIYSTEKTDCQVMLGEKSLSSNCITK